MSAEVPDEPDRRPGAPHPRETAVLFGQEAAEAAFLAAAASGRLPHGWLIAGPEGVGKATLAWRIARFLRGGGMDRPGDGLAMAPEAPVFRRAAALAEAGIWLCRRPWDDKSRRLRTAITVDEVRALKGFFQLSGSGAGDWRVAIVDAADELNGPAANALLKILEEPPERAALLLVAHRPARLLPTIRSRCRVLRCPPLAPAALTAALKAAGAEAAPDDAALMAGIAEGSVGRGFDLIAGGGAALWREMAALLAGLPGIDRRAAIALADSCAGRDGAARCQMALELLRIALARMARAAAGAGGAALTPDEAALWQRAGTGTATAAVWARAAAEVIDRAEAARLVNLDPGQVILDTVLRIDAVAGRAPGRSPMPAA